MGVSSLIVGLAATFCTIGQSIQPDEVKYQSSNFQRWWDTELVWKFADLPSKGSVPDHRVPYSGHDYPDRAGGTTRVLRKYDLAFHRGRNLATAFEERDVTAAREPTHRTVRAGLFRMRRRTVTTYETPSWHGHCNGWTAAAIRHAEPQKSVVRNGVEFSPADIKALLADIYMYTDNEFLGGVDNAINPGTLHVVIANWLGRGLHPVGMETTLGPEAFNYPIYAYESRSSRLSEKEVEVWLTATYALSTNREFDKSPRNSRRMQFHYALELDGEGKITGGRYFRDSSRVDMLWVPLKPAPGGTIANERGNPHIDVREVLAIWRESVPAELRMKWYNIDPPEEDRILEGEQTSDAAPGSPPKPPTGDSAEPTRGGT
jgi:hypothetical protein